MLNKVILMGRLCADPEFRQTTSGIPVCRIRLAVNRPYKKDTEQKADFINVSCWRNTAEFVSRYFSKGKMAIVEGCLRNNDYTDNNGVKHYSMEVLAQNVGFGEPKGSSSDSGQTNQTPHSDSVPSPYGQQVSAPPQAAEPAQSELSLGDLGEFEEILSDGEVPF
jgi:single-strand DNA-binding protein